MCEDWKARAERAEEKLEVLCEALVVLRDKTLDPQPGESNSPAARMERAKDWFYFVRGFVDEALKRARGEG